MGETTSEELLRERRQLLDEWDAVDSARKLLEIQEGIAEQIRDAERAIKDGSRDRDALAYHISQLRLYTDGLAWRVLHPHVIRQLAKNPSNPPSLMNQGQAFDDVLRSAREHLQEDALPVLIADITNTIRIGDLIVVTHPEFPQIVECKTRLPHPRHWMQGRIGRQISRALGTLRYLSGKPTKVHGEDHVRHVVECQHKAERNWEAVASCVNGALNHGEGFLELSEHEFIWACCHAHLSKVIERVGEVAKGLSSPMFFGTSEGLLNMVDGLFPPPVVWPLALEARFALIEREIVVAHLISAAAFDGDYGECRVQVTREQASRVSVLLGGKEYRLGLRFIYDVLYGFETVESCIRGLLTFARDLKDLHSREDEAVDKVAVPGKKPKVAYLSSDEGAARYAVVESGDDIVLVPEDLWRSVPSPVPEAKVPDSAPDSG